MKRKIMMAVLAIFTTLAMSVAMSADVVVVTTAPVILALGIFGLGAWAFWTVSTIVVLLMFACFEHENNGWATIIFGAFLAVLYFGSDVFQMFAWIFSSWTNITIAIGLFILLGVIYMPIKMVLKISDRKKVLKKHKKIFLKKHNIQQDVSAPVSEEWKEKWAEYQSRNSLSRLHASTKIANNKENMLVWAAYWPFFFTWDIINRPLRFIGTIAKNVTLKAYNAMKGGLGRIRDKMMKDIDQDYT
jgi:uncharacterized membrane protein YgaE (UPF0421/DUF939 family)